MEARRAFLKPADPDEEEADKLLIEWDREMPNNVTTEQHKAFLVNVLKRGRSLERQANEGRG